MKKRTRKNKDGRVKSSRKCDIKIVKSERNVFFITY